MSDHAPPGAAPTPGAPAPGPEGALSGLLLRVAGDTSRESVSVGELLDAMQDRATAALMFLFAFPNIFPMPPGTSALLGIPLIILTAQLALGRPAWLPGVITRRKVSHAGFAKVVGRVVPWLRRAERMLRPRLKRLVHPPAENVVGAVCLLLSVILYLPIPLSNMPPALAICMFSLGILEEDGLWAIAGLVTAVLSVLLSWGVIYALAKTALYLLANVFG